jgi:hypothetical protein
MAGSLPFNPNLVDEVDHNRMSLDKKYQANVS